MNGAAIGKAVTQARLRAGLTQVALADALGTTQSAISRLEGGRALPSIPMLERIARATGQPISIVIDPVDPLPDSAERRRRVRRALGDYVFNPWERNPTPAEARTLESDGLTRERFERS